jgi:TonB family protein
MTGRQLIPVDLPDQSVRKGIWIFAAALALGCHLAFVAFAIARMHEEPEDEDLGAPGIEIAFELASPQTSPSDLPPGPESEASAASPAVVERKATVKDADLPKEIPVESKEPDRLVTIDKSKTPIEEPDVTARMVKPTDESVAQEATAAPAIQNVPEAPTSTTRDQGTAESRQRARVTWQKELLAHLGKYKRYPTDRSQKSSEILVTLSLDRTGHVLAVNVARSSGDEAFDHAALSMVERASPVPAPPPLVADEGLSFSLPVIFRKNNR